MINSNIHNLLLEQLDFARFRASSFIGNSINQQKPQRSIYNKLFSYYSDWLDNSELSRCIVLTGLRGTGKTTLLFQLFSEIDTNSNIELQFFSLDQVKSILGLELSLIFEFLKKNHYFNNAKKYIIFIDEAQYDPLSLNTIKAFLAEYRNVFIYLAGTPTTLNNQTPSDINISFEELHPLSSSEYLKITKQKFKIPGLSSSIRNALFHSVSSDELYKSMQLLAPEINTYYKGTVLGDYYRYLSYGSLPHLIDINEESAVYEEVSRTLDRILYKDLQYAKFHPNTVALIPSMLFEISHMDQCNIKRMAEKFDFSRSKMSEIMDALENAGLLRRIYAYGPYLGEVVSRRSSKYLFATPVFRILNYRLMYDLLIHQHIKTKIIEDVVAMYMFRAFDQYDKGTLTYDSNPHGADLIACMDDVLIPLQIEGASEGYKEITNTMNRYTSKYGIIISDNQLSHDKEARIVKIPLRMFLLM